MNNGQQCRSCGASFSPDASAAFCPACALRSVLEPEEEPGPAAECGATFRLQRVGDYELVEEIARGGMGVVYRARQLSLKRTVALKMMLAGPLAAPAMIQRFRNEAEAAARLEHPNIVPIYEIGEHEGRHFFTMKFIEGGTIAGWRGKGPSGPETASHPTARSLPKEAVVLLAKVARAVDYAHQHGVLHRDLKPGNILVDLPGEPHVTDFGLAKLMESDSALTQSMTVLGTPAYMAPEQAAEGAPRATTASDVYSLGAVLYELLTGQPPFRADTPLALLKRVVDEEPARPRRFNPEIDSDLERICLKCLSKDPGGRYASAGALAEDLDRWRAGEPILARSSSSLERLGRWARRNPLPALLAGAMALLAVGFLLHLVNSRERIAREASRARRAEADATEKLWSSYLAQARAERRGGRAGQRFDSLDAVRSGAAIRPSLELRNEAIAAMALTDARFIHAWAAPPDPAVRYSPDLSFYAVISGQGAQVFRARDPIEVARWPSNDIRPTGVRTFSSDEQWLALEGAKGQTLLWKFRVPTEPIHVLAEKALDFTADSRFVITSAGGKQASLLNLPDLRVVRQFPLNARALAIRADPSGRYFAAWKDGISPIDIYRLADGSRIHSLALTASVWSLAWSSDGHRLAVWH